MPIYQDKRKGKKIPNKWRVRIWYKGKKRDWWVNGTKKEAEAFKARMRVELDQTDPTEDVRIVPTFLDFLTSRYLPHAQTHLKASTLSARKYQLATLTQAFGPLKLTQITTVRVEQFVQEQVARGLRPSTINDFTKVLSAVLKYATQIRIPTASPSFSKVPDRGRRKKPVWSQQEILRLYDEVQVHCPELLPVVVCLANTGMRRGEALALRWRDVDLEKRILHIRGSEDWQPKTDKDRQVPISDALYPVLQGLDRTSEWVFPCSSTGERYQFWPNRKFDKARKAAGLTGGPHTLRHSYASHMILETRDFFLVARLLGHSTAWVTERYAHLLPEHLDRARAALSIGTIRAVADDPVL